MNDLILNEQMQKDLYNFCMEMPTKFGLPIIEILQKLTVEQNKSEQTN